MVPRFTSSSSAACFTFFSLFSFLFCLSTRLDGLSAFGEDVKTNHTSVPCGFSCLVRRWLTSAHGRAVLTLGRDPPYRDQRSGAESDGRGSLSICHQDGMRRFVRSTRKPCLAIESGAHERNNQFSTSGRHNNNAAKTLAYMQ